MGYSAKIVLDSISPAGVRLTTMEVTFPRFVLSEFNTHRMFCLDGDTKLYFDLPSREEGGTKRFTMTLREFHEKWNEGAAPRKNNPKRVTANHLCFSATYSAKELAPLVGYRDYTAVDLLTRRAPISRVSIPGAPYRVRALDFAHWLYTDGVNRQPIRDRLRTMNLRSCNEDTGEIYHTNVRDVCFSGEKNVFRVTLEDGRKILSSADHQFLTREGWQRLEDAVGLVLSPGNIATWTKQPEFAVNGIDAYKDPEWLRAQRAAGYSAREIAEMAGVTLDKVKYQLKTHKIPVSNFSLVWKRSHTKEPWNKGRRYCNINTRGLPAKGRIRSGAESHLWRGGITSERAMIGKWTRGQAFRVHRANGFKCVLCGNPRNLHAHHIDPVAHNPARAQDPTNLTSVCGECHSDLHHRNIELVFLDFVQNGGAYSEFWNSVGGLRLRKPYEPKKKRAMVRHFLRLEKVEYAGVRETFDIEVDGPFHNFVADGFIVHNSRNSASSRAIPTSKLIERVVNDPVFPVEWGRNQKGMQAEDVITEAEQAEAKAHWLAARDAALAQARALGDLKVHKQIVNRILEPFMWHTVLVTATEWDNYFDLRCAPAAQPEIRTVAQMMRDVYSAAVPQTVGIGEWHLPLVQPDERNLDLETQKKISAARCARVSYLTHDGTRSIDADITLYDRLKGEKHLSPFEHVATPASDTEFHANFRGWVQMRKEIEAPSLV